MQGGDYEVFLSFRRPDTRAAFIDFLYFQLADAGVRVFRDDEELNYGEWIGSKLRLVIEKSKISIPILSKGYASSAWCLRELTQMMECMKRKGQIIMPIFYDVEPSEVRYQIRGYGKAFRLHEEKMRYGDETIREWRAALQVVASLQGFDLTADRIRNEEKIVKEVVAHLLSILKRNFVGIEHHVKGVMEKLNVESSDVRVV